MAVANQVVALRQESERLAKNQVTQGVITVSEQRHASAASYKSQAFTASESQLPACRGPSFNRASAYSLTKGSGTLAASAAQWTDCSAQ